jgi:hypothetical protein
VALCSSLQRGRTGGGWVGVFPRQTPASLALWFLDGALALGQLGSPVRRRLVRLACSRFSTFGVARTASRQDPFRGSERSDRSVSIDGRAYLQSCRGPSPLVYISFFNILPHCFVSCNEL